MVQKLKGWVIMEKIHEYFDPLSNLSRMFMGLPTISYRKYTNLDMPTSKMKSFIYIMGL